MGYVARVCWVVLMQKALLQAGWMSYRTPENRIRVKITNKPLMLVDLTIQGQSWQCDLSVQPALLLVACCVTCTVYLRKGSSAHLQQLGFTQF